MSANTAASAMAAPTAPLTIAMRCGVDTACAGGLVWAGRSSAVLLLLVARDWTCAFREDQALRTPRPAKEPVSRATTCERGRGGEDATIACGGDGWEVEEGRMRAQLWFWDVETLRSMIDVDRGVAWESTTTRPPLSLRKKK